MNSTCNTYTEAQKARPRIYFKKITFNDGTELDLQKNSITVFTGSNNCGKSQVLKDLERCVEYNDNTHKIVIYDTQQEYIGDIDEKTFLNEFFQQNENEDYILIGTGNGFNLDSLKGMWIDRHLYNDMHHTMIHRLSTEERLTSSNALDRVSYLLNHPIYKVYSNSKLESIISHYFRQAFNTDLIVNDKELSTIPLHVGNAPDKNEYTIADKDKYDAIVSSLPKLQDQGDGMRSFASILLNTFTSEYPITLIDEPEAFLHPPQARILGKILAKHNPENRQLFISTHSEDFLQGLLDADNNNVTVIRINRINNINEMSILRNDRIRELWGNPILRYSNILSGLFHSKVVVCESDYDCLFYQAIIGAIYEQKNEIAPDILFTHCGGKYRIPDIVSALKAVNVPVVAIVDFDEMKNEGKIFRKTIEAFGLKWDGQLYTKITSFYGSINERNSVSADVWDQLKKTGKYGLENTEPSDYEYIEKQCKCAGFFVVPVGEMECFDKTINEEKKNWVYEVLKRGNLATEVNLDIARRFVREVAEFELKEE